MNMPYLTGYVPHDSEGDEWTCERCGAVVANEDFTTVHTLFHDAIDSIHPTVEALVGASTLHAETLRTLLPGRSS